MIGIGLRFPAGRFHATPWGRHVNEAAPEWPPSPWRILRSLVAAWKVKVPDLKQQEVRMILEGLATPPEFCLPPATVAHTRHYMRWYKKGPRDQTLVFDAFVCMGRDSEVSVLWPEVELNTDQRHILDILLGRLGYLGRAESWCEACLLKDEETLAAAPNCEPINGEAPGPERELIRVLCADPETAFSDEYVRADVTERGRKKVTRPVYDPPWHLCIETAQLHAEKWSDPPGSKWISYSRRSDCFHPRSVVRVPLRRTRPKIQVARYVLDSRVLPLATDTLPIAEQIRAMLMGIYGRITERDGVRGRSAIFSGKDSEGRPMTGHSHAYYLPTDEDGDGRLDHLTVLTENGFDSAEVRALDRLRRLKRGEELPEMNLLLVGLGRLEDFQFPVLKQTKHWISATPFLVTRHPKKNGTKRDPSHLLADTGAFVEQVLREELERFILRHHFTWTAKEVEIRRLEDQAGVFRIQPSQWVVGATGADLRPLQFKRFRSRKRNDDGGRRRSGAFRLEFPSPIQGPICLGHSAHFGLGLFLPMREDEG